MRVRHRVLCGLACSVLLLAGVASATFADALSFQEIEESLTCQCGCGLTVHSCNHLQCPSAIPLREEIRAQMASSNDKEAILRYFADKYGEKILSAPTMAGFNVVAWVMPFALLAVAGIALGITVARWSRRGQQMTLEQPASRGASPYDKVLERELKNFDG